ncbi:MAG: CotH kinase family protein [Bacillota bacterium]|nr:CotH kinase family protein [Bacillota bacterium]
MLISKNIGRVAAILLVLALVFTIGLTYTPGHLGIEAAASEPEYQGAMFDKDEVTTIEIEIGEEEWAAILEDPLAEEYQLCDLVINGESFSSVGIRTKGNTSLSQVAQSDSERYSFKLKADEYVGGQSFFGLDEFVINNVVQDSTYMKEFLSYEMMEYMGVPTPLYAYAAIYINGEYWGLYLAVEAMEEDFAERVFGTGFGELYKPETAEMAGGNGEAAETPGGGNPGDATGEFSAGTVSGGAVEMPSGGGFGGGAPGEAPEETISGGAVEMPSGGGFGGGAPGEAPEETVSGGAVEMPSGGGFGGGAPGEAPEDLASGGAVEMPSGGGFGGGMTGSGGGADLVYTDDETESYSDIFDNAVFSSTNEADYRRVIAALKNLSEGTELESSIDVSEVLRYFAANTAMVNLDSYVSSLKHNYVLYEESGQLSILPWDFNLSFGTFQSSSATEAVNFPIDTPVSGVELSERPLIGALLEVEEYAEEYHEYLQNLLDGYFNADAFSSRIDEIAAMIDSYVSADPTAFYTYEEYQAGLETLKTFGALRSESIQGQLDGEIPSTEEGQQADGSALVDASSIDLSDMGTFGGGEKGGDRGRGRAGQALS